MVGFRDGGWHRAGHRENLGEFFQELERGSTMARTNDALSVEGLLTASGGMQGLKDVLSTVVQDALQSDPGRGDRAAGCGPLGIDRKAQRGEERFTAKDGVDPGGGCRGEDYQASIRVVLPGTARAAAQGRPGSVERDHDRLRDGNVDAEGR